MTVAGSRRDQSLMRTLQLTADAFNRLVKDTHHWTKG